MINHSSLLLIITEHFFINNSTLFNYSLCKYYYIFTVRQLQNCGRTMKKVVVNSNKQRAVSGCSSCWWWWKWFVPNALLMLKSGSKKGGLSQRHEL